jgi:signal transduction histidine kinase
MTAWAEMLSRIGQKNSHLFELVYKDSPAHHDSDEAGPAEGDTRASRALILEELERERSRIARELHAGAGQPLAGIKMNLEMLDDCADRLPPYGREALARLQTLAVQAMDQVRALSHRLYPPDWQLLSIEDAIRRLVVSSGLRDRIQVRLNIAELPVEPAHTTKIALYRCAQECIANVLRHSSASELGVSLLARGESVELRVEDNGEGLSAVAGQEGGIGLRALHEHARTLGGFCKIVSGGSGVTVTVELPLSAE